MKFTFKTIKPVFPSYSKCTYIKLNKKQIGSIDENKIRFMVMKSELDEANGVQSVDFNPNCKWKWITLRKQCNNLTEAKTWLNENITEILKKYTFHSID